MKKRVSRSLHLVTAEGAKTRKETYLGREYLVVPVVALVEGVIHPVNAETPELVTEDSYSLAPESWSGRPVFPAHPVRGGTQVLGNTPEIMESECVGIIFNSGVTKHKLAMEAWVNREDCERVGDHALDTYERAETGDPIEISVGATVLMEEVEGEYKGKKYKGRWVEVIPDHLALLPEGDLGACSIEMGCGVRTAIAHRICASGYEHVNKEGTLPAPKTEKKTPVRQSLVAMLSGLLRTASPSGWSDTEVRAELLAALYVVEPDLKYNGYPLDVYDNEGIVVYYLYNENYECELYARKYSWEGDKAVVDAKRVKVEATTVYVPTDSKDTLVAALVTAAGLPKITVTPVAASSCGCGANKNITSAEGAPMKTRSEVVAAMIAAKGSKFKAEDKTWLEAMPEEHFKKLIAASDSPEDEDEDEEDDEETDDTDDKDEKDEDESKEVRQTKGAKAAKDKKKVKAKKAAKRKPADSDDDEEEIDEIDEESRFLDRHPELKSLVERQRSSDARERDSLTTRILAASKEYTKKELGQMQFGQLQRLGRAMGLNREQSRQQETDFSGLPAYRELGAGGDEENGGVPEPPSLNERVRTAAGKPTTHH